jgi:hypothetical protein
MALRHRACSSRADYDLDRAVIISKSEVRAIGVLAHEVRDRVQVVVLNIGDEVARIYKAYMHSFNGRDISVRNFPIVILRQEGEPWSSSGRVAVLVLRGLNCKRSQLGS